MTAPGPRPWGRRSPRLAVAGCLALLAAAGSGLVGGLGVPAGAAPTGRVVLGNVPGLPLGARVVGSVPDAQTVSLDVVLHLPDPAAVSAAVAAISTPGSPEYHHYLAKGQFAAAYGPSPATVASVRSWLASASLTLGPTDPSGFLIPVSGSSAAVSQAFGTSLSAVRLADGEPAHTNTAPPSVPAAVAGAVAGVVGLDTAARYQSHLVTGSPAAPPMAPGATAVATGAALSAATLAPHAAVPQACPAAASVGAYTQSQVASIYDFSGLFAQGRTGAGQTVALFELEGFAPSDISQFEQCYGLTGSVGTVGVDGGPLPNAAPPGTGEAALDVENALAFAPGATVVAYEGPNNGGPGPLDVYARIAADDTAKVVSTSWGICESQMGSTAIQAEYMVFAQMAAQGQSVVAASGDTGSEDCNGNSSLAVDDPGSQPLVTSVGGTSLPDGTLSTQRVWRSAYGAGGGGVSSMWQMQDWQASAPGITGLGWTCPAGSTPLPGPRPAGNGSCREVPDIAALADPAMGYTIYHGGHWEGVGGTSAAAPLWAALLADVDQGCTAPVGFANPALYRLGGSSAFSDVTTGENDFTGTYGGSRYPATPGYDLASGWGSPNGSALAAGLQPAGGCPAVTGLSTSSGPLQGGRTLTVTGSGLGGATSVGLGTVGQGTIVASSAGSVTVVLPTAAAPALVDVTVSTANGTSAAVPADRYVFGSPHDGKGYYLSASDGGVFAFGAAGFFGSMGGRHLNAPIVGMAVTPDDGGYWEVASDGGIFAFGDAGFFGSMGGLHLNAPIVGIAPTPDGKGYWEVASDGGIFAFGDAGFYGSMGGRHLNAPIVAIAPTWDGKGYWEVASDGGIFAFGDAGFYGSMGGRPLNRPIVAIAATFDGRGYVLAASDGGIFAFGDAGFYGSMGGRPLNRPIVGAATTPDDGGYWEVASDGGIFAFGDAGFFGSAGSIRLVAPVVAMATT